MESKIVQFSGFVCILVVRKTSCKVLIHSCEDSNTTTPFSKLQQCSVLISEKELAKDNDTINGAHAEVIEDYTSNGTKALFVVVETASMYYDDKFWLNVYRVDLFYDASEITVTYAVTKFRTVQLKTCAFSKISTPTFLPGPSLIWTTQQDLHYINFNDQPIYSSCQIPSPFSKSNEKFRKRLVECIKFNISPSSTKILVFENTITKVGRILKGYFVTLNEGSSKIANISEVPLQIFMYKEYDNMVTAMKIYFPTNTDDVRTNCAKDNPEETFSILQRNSTCVTTGKKQFVVFMDGFILYCCNIPYISIRQILQVTQFLPYRSTFLLKGKEGICAIQRNAETKLIEVICKWDRVLDAFAYHQHGGRKETVAILITSLNQESQPSLQLIHDFNNAKEHKEYNAHISTVNEAMKERIQIARADLSRIETEVRDKQAVVETALHNLTIRKNEQTLNTEEETFPQALKEIAHWTSVWMDHWILGWTLGNYSKLTVSDIRAEICIPDHDVDSVQKVYFHPGSIYPHQPTLSSANKVKECAEPNQNVTVVIAFKLPWLSSSSVLASVLISWQVEELSQCQPFQCYLHVNHVFESSADKLEGLPIIQQIMSIRVLQQQCFLSLHSENNLVSTIKEMLLTNQNKKNFPTLLEHLGYEIFIFKDRTTPLFGVNFEFNIQSSQNAQILVNCSSRQDLLLFIHWFYSWLPKDFLLQESETCDQLNAKLKRCLTEELNMIESLFDQKSVNLASNASREIDQASCENQSKMLKGEECKVPYSKYQEFRRKLMELEMTSDRLVAQMK